MERITECTENVTTDTETESSVSNENFTLRKRKQGPTKNDILTMREGEQGTQSSLTKKGLVKLQKELVKKKSERSQDYSEQPKFQEPALAPQPPPPPPPPPPLTQNQPLLQPDHQIGTYISYVLT